MELYIYWILISFVFLMSELFIPGGFVFLFLGVASIFTGILSFLFHMSILHSVMIFSLLTVAFLTLFHNKYRSRWAPAHMDDMNNTLARLVGSTGTVIAIDNDTYKVKIKSHYWSARKMHLKDVIELNSLVRVVGYNQMTLKIELAESPVSTDSQ